MAGGHGGRRLGAGRKPGGGLPATTTLRAQARATLAEIVGTARDPLFVALEIAADPQRDDRLRLEAALGACRYLHPTLSAAQVDHRHHRAADAGEILARISERLGRLHDGRTVDACAEPAEAAE